MDSSLQSECNQNNVNVDADTSDHIIQLIDNSIAQLELFKSEVQIQMYTSKNQLSQQVRLTHDQLNSTFQDIYCTLGFQTSKAQAAIPPKTTTPQKKPKQPPSNPLLHHLTPSFDPTLPSLDTALNLPSIESSAHHPENFAPSDLQAKPPSLGKKRGRKGKQ